MPRLVSPGWLDPHWLWRIVIGCQAGLEEPWPSGAKGPGVPRVALKLYLCAGGSITFCLVCMCVDEFVCMGERSVWWGGELSRDEVGLVKPPLAV